MAEEGKRLGQREKFTRRQFIGRTLVTGAVIGSGYIPSSTTPVIPKVATTFKNLTVLSPHAKAYRTFLRGVKTSAGLKTLITRSPDPAVVFGSKAFSEGKNVARRAFRTAIETKHGGDRTRRISQALNNPDAKTIAGKILGKQKLKNIKKQNLKERVLAGKIHLSARREVASELRAERKANPNSRQALAEFKVRREFQAQDKHTANIQATKTTSTTSKGGGKSGGGGGGKFGWMRHGKHSPWSLLRNDKNF